MSIILDNLQVKDGHCPFPSCQASIAKADIKNGDRTCPECGRWAVLNSGNQTPSQGLIDVASFPRSRRPALKPESDERDRNLDSKLEALRVARGTKEEKEDIELYRQIHVQNTPFSNMDSFLGGRGFPSLSATEVIHSLQTSDGQTIKPVIFGRIDKGFFLADNDWTCYRRNYFSLDCSYTLQPTIPNGAEPMYLTQDGGPGPQVHGLAISIAAVVDGRNGKSIELVQHTKDKPALITLAPHPPASHGLEKDRTGRSNLYDSQGPNHNPDQLDMEATFERIQFTTTNSSKRRAVKQVYHLLVELFADVGGAHPDRWIKIA
ncbi:hypothetical protein B0J14DRAFT_685435 [Halenospora varia]|nr:hypothetical protein B0J14DRAFT_685435 [Halenospora varia]